MKILHFSNVYGDLEMLSNTVKYAEETKPDVVVCSGDIAGPCLPLEEAKQITRAFFDILKTINRRGNGRVNFHDYVRFLRGADFEPAEVYYELEKKFDEESERQYGQLLSLFAQFPQTVLTVPGNWDSKKYFEFFAKFDIHKKMKKVDGITFAGYGGSPVTSPFLPQTSAVAYSGRDLHRFLTRKDVQYDADVFVTHIPPRGIQDDELNKGSESLKDAMIESGPDLVLCGHSLLGLGHKKLEERIIVVNSGNLGDYLDREKGFLAEVGYDQVVDNTVVNHLLVGTNNDETVRAYREAAAASA